MPLTLTPKKFAAIRTKIMHRRAETLAAEIDAATHWNDQPHFSDVDDFLKFTDTAEELSEPRRRRSSKRP